MTMFSKTVAERTKPEQRQDIEEKGTYTWFRIWKVLIWLVITTTDFVFHVYARSQGIAGVIISDSEYPSLAAHQVLSKVVDEFLSQNPSVGPNTTSPVAYPALKTYITKFQDPEQVDSIVKIQRELDETKIVLHKTIESVSPSKPSSFPNKLTSVKVLQRGEKLDDLISKSEGLSAQSKMFYTSAKKQNSCCIIQ
jgi:synaptobrevin family protein YKT6